MNLPYAIAKNGNRYDYSIDNVIWSNTKNEINTITLENHVVMDASFEYYGPIIFDTNFKNHQIIKYQEDIYQESIELKFIKAPKIEDEWLVITDENNIVGIQ